MPPDLIDLPAPDTDAGPPLDAVMAARRSHREYAGAPLSLAEVGQMLWAGQGVCAPHRRTAPSAGALYPLALHLVAGAVDGLAAGVWRYHVHHHRLEQTVDGDVRADLARLCVDQDWIAVAPAAIVIAGIDERTAVKYKGRAHRYVLIEVGHAGQNLLLTATALGLGACVVGAFADEGLRGLLHLDDTERPYSVIPFGR